MSHSIYQSNGKPLSQQAIYQQRLKQGVFGGPGGPTVGVNSNASDTAALLAASSDLTVKPTYERTVAQEAHTAALAARSESISIWKKDKTSAYADAAATSSLTSKVSGGSLKPTQSSSTSLNIDKISKLANKNSTKTLNSRFNPEADVKRHGLKIKPAEYLNNEEEELAAEGAEASLKHGAGYSTQVATQRRSQTFKSSDVAYPSLLSAATERAQDRLKTFNSTTPADFKSQAQAYANALAIAQKNSDARIKDNQSGLIQLGGGLTTTQAELDKMASLIVQPVIADIGAKAKDQREHDIVFKKKYDELASKHKQAKEDEALKKSQDRADIELAKLDRIKANDEKMKGTETDLENHKSTRNKEVEDKVAELREAETKYAEEREELLAEKQANQDRIDEEESKLIKEREDELAQMQSEKDEIIKPTLDSLKEETAKLKELTDARDAVKGEVEAAEKLNSDYETQLKELNEKLDSTKAEIEEYTTKLEEAEKEHEESTAQVDESHKKSASELQEAEQSHKDYDEKIKELEKQKEQHLASKAAKKDEIKKELDTKVKEEHQINNELPEHLRSDIDEDKLRDTGSLFSVEEPAVKQVPLINKKEAEPKATETEAEVKQAAPAKETSAPKKQPVHVVPTNPKYQTAKKAATDTKKKGFRRFTSFLRSSSKDSSSTPATKPQTKSSTPGQVTKAAAKEEKKPSKPAVSKEGSEVSNDFDDELSLDKSKNQGGLFKEEI